MSLDKDDISTITAKSVRNITYICDWLPPDFGAVGQYSVIFARNYASLGKHVTLLGLSSTKDSVERENCGTGTLLIKKFKANTYEKNRTLTRFLWTVKANIRLLTRGFGDLRKADEIIFTGSPPFMIHFLVPLNWFIRKKLVYRITDFHPECMMAPMSRVPIWLRAIYKLTVFWRKQISEFQALGEDQSKRLLEIGIPDERISIKRDPSPVEIDSSTLPMDRPEQAGDAILLLYSGNWGVAHDVDTFLNGYREHHKNGSARVILWLNAVGSGVPGVRRELKKQGLPVISGNPVPLEELASLLVTPDAHLITMFDEFVGFVLPSKVYGCAESGRSVIFIGSSESDVDLICRTKLHEQIYHRVDVGDDKGFLNCLEQLADQVESERKLKCSEQDSEIKSNNRELS